MAQTITNSQVGIGNNNEEEEQNPNSAGSSSPTNNTSSSNNSNIVSPSTGPSPTGQAARQGSGFVNLQNIINANQNNNLGNTVSSDLNNYANQTQSGIQNAQNTFNTDANQYNYNTSQNQATAQNDVNSILNSSSPTVSAQVQTDYSTWLNPTYGGPNSLTDVNAGLGNQVSDVNSLANGGNNALLQRFVGGANYTAGDQNLDNVLLNATGGPQVQNAENNARNVQNQYNQANNAAQNQAQTIQQQNQAFSGQLLGDLGSNFQNIYGNAQNQAGTDTSQENQLIKDVQNNQLTSGDINTLGLNSGERLYNANLGSYLNATSPQTVTAQQAATPQELAQLQALSSLSNGQLSPSLTNDISGWTDSNIGGYNPSSVFNTAGLNSYIQNAQNTLSGQVNPLQNQETVDNAIGNYKVDQATGQLTNPISATNTGSFINQIQNQVNNGNTYANTNPADANLYNQAGATGLQGSSDANNWYGMGNATAAQIAALQQAAGYNDLLNAYGGAVQPK